MKNLIIAFTLFISLLVFGAFVVTRSIEAQAVDVLPLLLELPAPPPPNPLMPNNFRERSEEFYSKSNPPADNAPLDELLDYWKMQSERFTDLGYNPELSGRSLDRILGEIKKDPDRLTDFLNILPATPDVTEMVKRLYDGRSSVENEDEDYGENNLRNWLKYRSDYFSDELFAAAQSVGDTSNGYVSSQEDLLALARVNWNKAKPILDRLYNDPNQPVSKTLARWAFYRHALDTDSLGDIERYRDELKADVENKKASDGLRDLALDALTKEKSWNGRDDWYFGLLEDETLADLRVDDTTYTGLTTLMLSEPPEKYADKMIELVKSGNPTVRNAAVRNLGTLLDNKNIEIIKALLPWLEDANWAKETGGERQKLIAALQNFEIPESVPGLIALLDEKASREVADYSSMSNMANMMRMNTNVAVISKNVNFYPFRSEAISALAKQKDLRAVPALRRILPQAELYERPNVIRAIFLSNGFSIPEQVAALETAAQTVREEMETEVAERKARLAKKTFEEDESDEEVVDKEIIRKDFETVMPVANSYSLEQKPQPITAAEIRYTLGQQIIANPEPSAELLAAVVQRINTLDRQSSPIANALRRIMLGWKGAAVNLVLLNDLKNNKADINAIIKLLTIRKELKEKQPNDVYSIRAGGSSIALGIAACLLDTTGDYNALLVSDNAEAKAAMFGCARLIRAELPVRIVAQNLSSPNKLLALAAERYLEAEDSPEARQIILAKYPNEAKILGARTFFGENSDTPDPAMAAALFKSVENFPWFDESYLFYNDDKKVRKTEKKLQKEVMDTPDLLGVYAFDDSFVRIYQDRVMFSFAEDESRYRERYLTEAEFNNLKNYLASSRVDELVPFLSYCEGCEESELLMLGRQGGRRVYFKGDTPPEFFAGLDKLFEEMRKPPAKLRYELEKSIAGLEILFADENLKAGTVWKNGGELRLLIADTKLRSQIEEDLLKQQSAVKYDENTDYEEVAKANSERRRQREFDHLSWRKLDGENIGELTAPPQTFGIPPVRDAFAVLSSPEQWKARTAMLEIRADLTGLYKVSGGNIKKIRDGFYGNPIVTPDGRWAIAAKLEDAEGFVLVRVNLSNNQEFKVKTEGFGRVDPIAALPSGKKILFRIIRYDEYYNELRTSSETDEFSPRSAGEIFVLDVETGAIEKARGEIRPFAGQTFRPLQKAVSADEYWAAIPGAKATQVGTYNMKTFSFKPLMTIPNISFDSMNMWVDEAENKVYFVYKGQLLALSLPKK
ncbi:MAG: HEAT repeat domain-containing protein [Pyrinomonadaceae bacterium]